jgi:anaerobic magnesium-protoporphyrin IX monomethyl ester cyclase
MALQETNQHQTDRDTRGIRVCLLTLYLSESLGARQLCSILKARGHDCSLVFFKEFRWGEFRHITPREEDLLLGLLRDIRPDLVGLSLTSSLVADVALDLADKIRRTLDVPVILGGAHPSVAPEECLEHADIVCIGEGDGAIADLAEALAAGRGYHDIPNLWTRANGEIHRNDVRPLSDNLDSLPFASYGDPDSYVIEYDRLERADPATRIPMYHTYASRMACPFKCAFCAGVWFRHELYADKGPVRRYRSVANILADVKHARARSPNIEVVQFWDEIFAVRPPQGWLDEFCERFPKEIGLPYAIWSHPSLINGRRVAQLRNAGLKSVVLGIESGSERVRREIINRGESNKTILRAAQTLHQHGVTVGYDFILDIPWLAEENCRGTFELIMQLPRPLNAGLHSLSFLPRTAITSRALAEGLIQPGQVAGADRALSERFESFLWKYRLHARDRSGAFWHSLIYLATTPLLSRPALWKLYRLRRLLRLHPQPLVMAAEAARLKKDTGQLRLWQALSVAYPSLAAFLARHPTVGRFVNSTVRVLARIALRAATLARRQAGAPG